MCIAAQILVTANTKEPPTNLGIIRFISIATGMHVSIWHVVTMGLGSVA